MKCFADSSRAGGCRPSLLAFVLAGLVCTVQESGAAIQRTHPLTVEAFVALEIERIACPEEVLHSMKENVAVDCGRISRPFKAFRKAWKRFVKPTERTSDTWHALPRWFRAGEERRRQYFLVNSTPFLLTFHEASHQLDIAWIARYPSCPGRESEPPLPRPMEDPAITNPAISNQVFPDYPESARISRASGAVFLSTKIDELGRTTDICVVSAAPKNQGFEDAAIAAVEQWRYEPATRDGQPIPVEITVTVTFHVSGAYVPLSALFAELFAGP